MARLDRRGFLSWMAAGVAVRPAPLHGEGEFPVTFREPGPCADLVPFVDAANDRFEHEKRGMAVERQFAQVLDGGSLRVVDGLRGISPVPERYEKSGPALIARYSDRPQDIAGAIRDWVASLGAVRRADFHALPGDVVRYEVASESDAGLAYRVGHWRISWQGGAVVAFEPLEETIARSPAPLFADVTGELFGDVPSFRDQLSKGIPYWRSRLDSAAGVGVYGNQGIAVGDIDGDGWDEVYVCQPGGLPNRLYSRTSEGRWADITEQAGVAVLDDTAQALFLDLRNVGSQDLVVLTAAGPLLFLNDGGGRFRARDDAFRFRAEAQGTFAGMAAADYDLDGRVDLYLCSYLYFRSEDQYRYPVPYHDARNGPPNFLFRNGLDADGRGAFEDVTEIAGLGENNDRYSFAASWCDYDEDGRPELYVANDFGRNNLYKWEDGRFRDIAARAGVEDVGPGMSAAWFDFDRDGRMDLYVTNMWTAAGQRVTAEEGFQPVAAGASPSDYRAHTKGNSVYRNRGDGTFESVGGTQGAAMGRWSWSGDGIDFDLDGYPEVLVTAGMITHSPDKDLCSFFWRRVVAESPARAQPAAGYEEGWNCLNQLVREDYSWNGNEPNVFYVRSGGTYRDFSGVSGLDRAADSRAFAVTDFDGDGRPDLFLKSRLGPQVIAFRNDSAGTRQALVIELEGTHSNRDGIGAVVRVETEDGVSAQSLSAGSGYISQHTKRLHFGLGERSMARAVRVLWPSGATQSFKGLEAGYRYRIREGESEPARSRLASRGAPVPAPRVEGDNRLVFEPTWLWEPLPLPEPASEGFLVLTDGPPAASLPASLPHEVVDLRAEDPPRAAAFALFRRYLFDYRVPLRLPLVLLVDGDSRVHKVYPEIEPEDVLRRDWALLQDPQRPALGLPYEGMLFGPLRRNHFRMGSAFLQAGYPALALPYLRAAATSESGSFKAWLSVGQIELQDGNLEAAEEALDRAAELNPNSPELWNNLGGLAMARDDFDSAAEHFRAALETNPDLTYALVNAAQAQVRLGNQGEAERLLRRALAVDPADAEAANKLGLVLAKQGRLAEARSLFQQAIENQRDHAEAINNLAVLYVQLRQLQDAMAALRYGLEQVPDFDSFYLNLARLHADLGDFGSARQVLRDLLDRKPGHEAAAKALAGIQFR